MFSYASQRFRLLFEGFDCAAEAAGTSLRDPQPKELPGSAHRG